MKTIKDVSKISGLSKRTLQYYDEQGLLSVKRSKQNYRLYSETDMERLWKILLYKEIGFGLDEIHRLLCLSEKDMEKVLQDRVDKISMEIYRLNEQRRFAEAMKRHDIPQSYIDNNAGNKSTYIEVISELKCRC